MALVAKRAPLALSIVYFRPTNANCTALDGKLFDLASRHRDVARLVVKHGDERGEMLGGWVSGSCPTVLFVRDGRSVAQLVGDLPAHELEQLLRAALTARADDVASPLACTG